MGEFVINGKKIEAKSRAEAWSKYLAAMGKGAQNQPAPAVGPPHPPVAPAKPAPAAAAVPFAHAPAKAVQAGPPAHPPVAPVKAAVAFPPAPAVPAPASGARGPVVLAPAVILRYCSFCHEPREPKSWNCKVCGKGLTPYTKQRVQKLRQDLASVVLDGWELRDNQHNRCVYRGEEGRTPDQLCGHSGFYCRQLIRTRADKRLEEAKHNLKTFAESGKLLRKMQDWFEYQKDEDAHFVSTGMVPELAYDTDRYFYKVVFPDTLQKRPWWSEAKNVDYIDLWTDNIAIQSCTHIVLIGKAFHSKEPLVVTPVPTDMIYLRTDYDPHCIYYQNRAERLDPKFVPIFTQLAAQNNPKEFVTIRDKDRLKWPFNPYIEGDYYPDELYKMGLG
jgi:hypothetical protein